MSTRKPIIVSVDPSPVQKLPFPRVMWADYDPTGVKGSIVVVYDLKSKAWQRGIRKPIRVLVVKLDEDSPWGAIANAIDVLNRCAEQGVRL